MSDRLKLKSIAEGLGFTFITQTVNGVDSALDKIVKVDSGSLPLVALIYPLGGEMRTDSLGDVFDRPRVRLAIIDTMERMEELTEADIVTVERLTGEAASLYASIVKSGEWDDIGSMTYTVRLHAFDADMAVVEMYINMTNKDGVCV